MKSATELRLFRATVGAIALAGITFEAQGVNVPMPALPLGAVRSD